MDRNGIKNAQLVLRAVAGYAGAIDGKPGAQSCAAAMRVPGSPEIIRQLPPKRKIIAAAQLILEAAGFEPGPADGFWGVQTDGAFLEWRAKGLGVPFLDRDEESDFGRQDEVAQIFGPAGSPACTAGQIIPPWKMFLAWDTAEPVRQISCHQDVAVSGQRALDRIAGVYSLAQIRDLGLDLYGGCFNHRKKRGGTSLSMHAYGVAIDFDPARNRLSWGADRARLAQPDAVPFWQAWEAVGWLSLGRARDYDWMHVQAPAL